MITSIVPATTSPILHLDFRIITTITQFDALKDGWRALSGSVQENTGFFASWDYTAAYIKFHRPNGWVVIVAYADSSKIPVAVFPLISFTIAHDGKSFKAYKALGIPYISYIEFPIQDGIREVLLPKLLSDVLQTYLRCDVLFFGPFSESSLTYLALVESLPKDQIKTLRHRTLSQIDCRGQSFEDFFAQRKKSTLPDARRCERRLRELGQLEFCCPDHHSDLNELVAVLCRQSAENFGSKHLLGTQSDWAGFFSKLIAELGPVGLIEMSTLRLDGRVIASHLGFLFKGRRYYYLPAYDQEFSRFSPSKVLMAKLIERSFHENGVFCFGSGTYPYKLDWCQTVGEVKIPIVFFDPAARRALDDYIDLRSYGRVAVQQ